MLLEPDERDPAPDTLRQRLGSQHESGGFDPVAGGVVHAVAQPPFVGWLQVDVASYRRVAHIGYLVLGVHAGRGIGTALLQAAVARATACGLHRLELTVLAANTRAVELCGCHLFQVEGRRRSAFRLHGELLDELYMGLTT
jgi:RimJ/RimL family protein N-acetyltransferase